MTDIIPWLRHMAKLLKFDLAPRLNEAADEIERLREKTEILEAEIRVMRKLPAAMDAAFSAGQGKQETNQ